MIFYFWLLHGFFSFAIKTNLGPSSIKSTPHPERAKKLSKASRLFIIGIILLFINVFIFGIIIMYFADVEYNTSFRQRLTVLAPMLSEIEEEELEARWASMRNRADYEAIEAEIEKLANNHSLQLPPSLLK